MPIQDYAFQRYSFYDRRDVAMTLAPTTYSFKPQRGSWGISGIVHFGKGPNYVFFVSFGQTQAGHDFDEAVYSNGIVRWQSHPAQTLATPMIQKLVRHNHLENDILLFLRTKLEGPYIFMGFLKYVRHDQERERPVHFDWQILDFDSTKDYESLFGLKMEPTSAADAIDTPGRQSTAQTLVAMPAPSISSGVKGVAILTADFRRSPIDYEERDRKSRRLGMLGEDLAFGYERAELIKAGRQDLAERVEMVCRTLGDTAGFDIRSFDKNTGEEIHLEVKTTSGPLTTPFFMSAAEVAHARTCQLRYKIYRIYAYSGDASEIQFFAIERPMETLEFTPAIFRVRQK
jgi:hypothetical protein